MTIFGDGLQTRAFSYIDDVAPAIARAPITSGCYQEVFNIGADRPYSVLELAKEIASAFGVPASIVHLEARNEVVDAYASHEKARNMFDLPAPVALRLGIERMARWVRTRGVATPVEFGDIEVSIGIPNSWLPKPNREVLK